MKYCLLLSFCFLLTLQIGEAQGKRRPDSLQSGLRISVLTGGQGRPLYTACGHSAIRIIDSSTHTDMVYNYGVFDFNTPHFYFHFIIGEQVYYVAKYKFKNFANMFVAEDRSLREQVLKLPEREKYALKKRLDYNVLPQNKDYYYNFFYANCATKVRDVFVSVLGPKFHFGKIISDPPHSFRDMLHIYLANRPWDKFGVDLVFARPTDKIMTNKEAMFLPDNVYRAISEATYKGQPIVSNVNYLIPRGFQKAASPDWPFWTMLAILIIILAVYFWSPLLAIKNIVRFLLFFVTGLLGCFLLFLWIGTKHQAFDTNFNILWAFPLNIIIAFLKNKKGPFLKIYSTFAIGLIIAAIILSFIGVQKLPLTELWPLLVGLFIVYADSFNATKPFPKAGEHSLVSLKNK